MNSYELLFIAEPSLDQERLAVIQDRIKNLITNGNGIIDSVDDWGIRRLAYKINKSEEGRYILINFQSASSLVSALDRQMRLLQDVIRFMVVRKGD